MNITGRIFDIQKGSLVDGSGVRTAVFFKGCNLSCKWCHNPESQEYKIQIMHYRDKCTSCLKCKSVCPHSDGCVLCGRCALYCPNDAKEICGRDCTYDEIMAEIESQVEFYEETGGGVTFTGGECMLQINFLKELLKGCRKRAIHTCIDTAGNVPFEYFERIIPYTSTFLYDVKCITEDLHEKGTGKSNRLILDNLKKLSEKSCEIIIRIPLIGGFNDTDEEIGKIKDFLKNLNYKAVEVLPYHSMGNHKYDALGIRCTEFKAPTKERVAQIKEFLTK